MSITSMSAIAPIKDSIQSSRLLRNTYSLLSVTVLWSALFAYAGAHMGIGLGAYIGLAIGGLIMLLCTLAFRNSGWGILFIFLFTGLEGLSLGPVLAHYASLPGGSATIVQAGGLTGLIFLALSGYVLVTKKSFSFMGGFLFAGLIAVVIAAIASMFYPVMQTAVAAVSALLFSGYILYDTSRIIEGGETSYVSATVSLYLDTLNLFLSLLRLLKE